jgi:hypothetical protein
VEALDYDMISAVWYPYFAEQFSRRKRLPRIWFRISINRKTTQQYSYTVRDSLHTEVGISHACA